MTKTTNADVEKRVTALADLGRPALLELWKSSCGPKVPPRLSRALLEKAMAYEIQVAAYGGLSKRSCRALKAAANADRGKPAPSGPGKGARLLREWQGEIHEVEVLQEGYLYRGGHYRSLSAIARTITGARWSGPRFFNLRQGP